MADTRSRMVDAAVHALQQRGVAGMSFTEVLRDSGAARGAIYHHFPGGKTQLVTEAAARNGADVRVSLATLPADSPRAVVTAFLDAIRPVLAASTTGGGCALAAVTIGEVGEQETSELRRIAADAFSAWTQTLAERLITAGLRPDDATDLATTLITLLEGAHVLCRATGNLAPFDRVARTAQVLIPGEPAR